MARVYSSILQLIGNTPLLELSRYENLYQLQAKIIVKLEMFNPAGSVKDRIALKMIENAEKKGILTAGATLIEPTSGNTGIGIAVVAAAKGYQAIIVMPETMTVERRKLLQAYGAKVILTDGTRGMKCAIDEAERLNREIPNSYILSQFTNQSNPNAHKCTTGPEIWKGLKGNIDIFVAGVGTGGTISGVGEYLKEQNPAIKIVAVEPAGFSVLSGKKQGCHKIQGIGPGFIPSTLNTKIYDEIITVKDEDAFRAGREIALTDGVLAGISSGAAVYAATILAKRPENAGKNIVTILPDTGERYLSTALFQVQE